MCNSSNYQTDLVEEEISSHEGEIASETQKGKGHKASNKAYKILNFIPTVAFLSFAILMVVFMALLPVANIDALGIKEKYGTILSGVRFSEITGLNSLSITLLIIALVTIIYAITLVIHKFSVLKYRKIFGVKLYKLLEVLAVLFILVYLVFSITIITKINSADDGAGIIKVGSYPILTVILSIICLLGIAVSIFLRDSHEKSNPIIVEEWEEARQEAKNKPKESVTKKVGAKFGAKYIVLTLILVALTVLGGTSQVADIVQRFNEKSFNEGVLLTTIKLDDGKFELGKSEIELALGKSYVEPGSTADGKKAVYYTENYLELLGKMERNQKFAILAIEQGDYRLSGLLKQAKNLEIERETTVYGKAEITYNDNYRVTEVVYNNVVIEGIGSISKKLDKVEILKVWEVYPQQNQITKKINEILYLATYVDGSFIYGNCKNVAIVLDDGTISNEYEGSYVGKTLTWQDEFGKYQIKATNNQN